MQSTQYPLELKNDKSPFAMIYQAAKEKSEKKLIPALSFACIDVYHGRDYGTPITKLAAENDKDSVSFLIKFNASFGWAASGFARGGHKTEAYALLELDVVKRDPAKITSVLNCMAHGFAQGGHKTEAYALLALDVVKRDPAKITSVLNNMTSGFARGGHKTEAYALLALDVVKRDPAKITSVLNCMASGFAGGGHKTEAYALLALDVVKRDPAKITSVLNEMAYGFARGGHKTEAYALLELNVVKRDPAKITSVLNCMAYGFARGGHKTEAYALLALDVVKRDPAKITSVLNYMASGFAGGGHKTEADALLALDVVKRDPAKIASVLNYMASGFARGGHKPEAYALLELDVVKRDPAKIAYMLKCIANAENQNGGCIDKAVVLKTLTMIENQNSRTELADELKNTVTAYNTLSLVPQAAKFNKRMKEQDITYNQLLGWIQPEMQVFLLQGIAIVHKGKLTSSLFLSVATFLSPMTLPEACDLSNKFAMQTCRVRFFRNLKNHGTLLLTDKSMAPLKQEKDKLKEEKNTVHLRT